MNLWTSDQGPYFTDEQQIKKPKVTYEHRSPKKYKLSDDFIMLNIFVSLKLW